MHKLFHQLAGAIAAFALCAMAPLAAAQTAELDASLGETVQMIPKKAGSLTFELETTIYRPDGDGPFPIALINHGKAFGDPRLQKRYRPAVAARYFLERGYAVVVPMRQGFSRSTGDYVIGGCNVERNGRTQAEDVRAVLDHVATQPWADMGRIVVVGQSHGGWTTLAFGTHNYPGVKGLVNFAGGLRQQQCPHWKAALAGGAGHYARETKVPSLWFYGDNDSYFDADTFKPMLAQYASAGGNARIVAFGKFGSDAHALFGAGAGAPIWQPEVTRFLAAVGMPSEVQPAFAKYAPAALTPRPPPTGFAAADDETRLPYVRESGRAGYKIYLTKTSPRAFAIARGGSWGWAAGGDDPLKRALDNCNRNGRGECKLYSVDDTVVWSAP
jgi:dienelactone hydrolase